MLALKHGKALRRELVASRCIPYTAQISEHVVKTQFGDYLQVLKLSGASFETADDEQLNTWHERLNVLWRNIARPNVALWVHLIRRREQTQIHDESSEGFTAALTRKYERRLSGERLMVNEIYLSVIYRPTAGLATGLAAAREFHLCPRASGSSSGRITQRENSRRTWEAKNRRDPKNS